MRFMLIVRLDHHGGLFRFDLLDKYATGFLLLLLGIEVFFPCTFPSFIRNITFKVVNVVVSVVNVTYGVEFAC
jgi:hypothetical protein